jgi:hypothetical protein
LTRFLRVHDCKPEGVHILTGQVSDEFRYNGEVFSLVGINGKGLYTPADFGMATTMAERRLAGRNKPARPSTEDDDDVRDWIEDRF